MAAHEQVNRHQRGKGQQQPHQHRRHHEIAHGSVSRLARVAQVGVHVGGQGALLGRQVHHFPCGAKAPQQGINRECHDAQHHDFAKRIKAPEVHEHHVDNIGATAFGERPRQKKGGGAFGKGTAHHGERQHRHASAGTHRQYQIAVAAQLGAACLRERGNVQVDVAPGQPAQAQKDENGGHYLDHNLCQCEIGRRKPQERNAHTHPGAAQQGQCRQPVVFGLPCRSNGAHSAQHPQQGKGRR